MSARKQKSLNNSVAAYFFLSPPANDLAPPKVRMSSSALRNVDDLELGSITHVASSAYHDDQNSGPDSPRSTLEDDCYYQRQDCTVYIHDDTSTRRAADAVDDNKLVNPSSYKIYRDPKEVRQCLGVSTFASYVTPLE